MPPRRMPRGAIPSPRNVLAAAIPHQVVTAPPPNLFIRPAQLSFWGNEAYGDCVTAEEAFAKACYNPEIFISEDAAIGWARSNSFLNGAVISDVLQTMMTGGFPAAFPMARPATEGGVQEGKGPPVGFHIYDDGPHFSVDWTNSAVLQSAIATGPVKLGVASNELEDVWNLAGGANGWFATGFKPDATEDHCISLCGYGTISWLAQQLGVPVPASVDGANPGYGAFTWNSIGIIDVPSMVAITHEAWVRNPTTVIKFE
jgi:hypothetical protein